MFWWCIWWNDQRLRQRRMCCKWHLYNQWLYPVLKHYHLAIASIYFIFKKSPVVGIIPINVMFIFTLLEMYNTEQHFLNLVGPQGPVHSYAHIMFMYYFQKSVNKQTKFVWRWCWPNVEYCPQAQNATSLNEIIYCCKGKLCNKGYIDYKGEPTNYGQTATYNLAIIAITCFVNYFYRN